VSRLITRKRDDGTVLATAVEFEHSGKLYIVNIGKEAIISAGYAFSKVYQKADRIEFSAVRALKSPQILELSGIGLSEVLQRIGVPVQVELPVGENMQEHVQCSLPFRTFIAAVCSMNMKLTMPREEIRDDVDSDTNDVLRDLKEAEKQLKLQLVLHPGSNV
jgi:choline dehydrogenase-like flavoprotein